MDIHEGVINRQATTLNYQQLVEGMGVVQDSRIKREVAHDVRDWKFFII